MISNSRSRGSRLNLSESISRQSSIFIKSDKIFKELRANYKTEIDAMQETQNNSPNNRKTDHNNSSISVFNYSIASKLIQEGDFRLKSGKIRSKSQRVLNEIKGWKQDLSVSSIMYKENEFGIKGERKWIPVTMVRNISTREEIKKDDPDVITFY